MATSKTIFVKDLDKLIPTESQSIQLLNKQCFFLTALTSMSSEPLKKKTPAFLTTAKSLQHSTGMQRLAITDLVSDGC